MTDYYLDASALVKRYADEPGSTWIRQVTDPLTQNSVLIAEITLAEIAAALAAKHRAPGGITQEQRDRALSRFLQDCDEHFLLLPVDRPVIDRAVELTQNHRLRGYDAVQLAIALVTSETLGFEVRGSMFEEAMSHDHGLNTSSTSTSKPASSAEEATSPGPHWPRKR